MVDGVRLSGALAACLALLLGEEPYGNNGALAKGRAWILSHGGATFIPQWGKIWLSVFFAIHTCVQHVSHP